MRLTALALGALALTSCAKSPTPPSTSFKLVCRDGDQQLVFVLDAKTRTVVLANLPDAPVGTFSTTDYEYHLAFPETKRVRAGEAVVNRYDGQMVREIGKPPYALDGITIPEGNLVHNWKCARTEAKPIL